MNKTKFSITLKVLVGFLILTAFAGFTIWFIYNKAVELNKPSSSDDDNQKMALISNAATRLYTTEGMGRNIIQSKDTTDFSEFHASIDTVSQILDSLKTLYSDEKSTQNEIDSINHLLHLKEDNIHELINFRKENKSEGYYQRVMGRLEQKEFTFDSTNYDQMLDKLGSNQREIVVGYLKYAEERNADLQSSRMTDSLIKTVRNALLSLEFQEHRYQQSISAKENKLLNNDLKLSNRLRKVRNNIEQEEFQKSLARVRSTKDSLSESVKIMIYFGIASVITILFFLLIVIRDMNKSQRYRKELEEAKVYAESLLKSREQILATVTHDLRSPLNSILGYSDLMDKTELTPKQRNYLEQLQNSSDYTMRLVNDLLDLSRLEAGKIQLEKLPFIPKNLIEDSAETNIPSPEPKNLNIHFSLDSEFKDTFLADPFRIRQILSNLIGNAYKFTKKGSLEISGHTISEDEKIFMIITVKDTGIGMSEDQQKVIFEEFSQADKTTEKQYGGSGLGLAISQKLTKLLNGNIQVESELGQGSKFTLAIPVEKTETSARIKEEKRIRLINVDDQHILLVDDDKTQLDLIEEILKNQGFAITTASNGKEAVKILKNKSFEAVFTDIQMPKLDGFKLAQFIQKNDKTKHIPVVALSGQTGKNKVEYLNNGFTDYILKPYKPNDLLKVVAKIFDLETEVVSGSIQNTSKKPTVLFDLSDLEIFTGGDEDSLKTIIETLIEDSQVNLDRLKEGTQKQDWEKVSFTAHKMLPMLRQIKAKKLINPLIKLEKQADKSQDLEKLVEEVTEGMELILPKLKAEIE